MKMVNDKVLPLKIRKTSTDAENINITNYKSVIYNREVNIASLNVDSTSSITFAKPLVAQIPSLTVSSGKTLLIDRDCVFMEDVTVENGGELRII